MPFTNNSMPFGGRLFKAPLPRVHRLLSIPSGHRTLNTPIEPHKNENIQWPLQQFNVKVEQVLKVLQILLSSLLYCFILFYFISLNFCGQYLCCFLHILLGQQPIHCIIGLMSNLIVTWIWSVVHIFYNWHKTMAEGEWIPLSLGINLAESGPIFT